MVPSSIEPMLESVRRAGALALQEQQALSFDDRSYKDDGTILTRADARVEEVLLAEIRRWYPEANVLAEETVRQYDPARPFTFAVDPIDGTDAFSQGMPGWCVSLALIDADHHPVAGVVYAPRLDMLFVAEVGQPATLNGTPIRPAEAADEVTELTNLMVPSRIHHLVDLKRYPGKMRNIGSAALHLCFVPLYAAVYGAIESPATRVWDLAGAHAVIRSLGYVLERQRGGLLTYEAMMDGRPVGDLLICGTKAHVEVLRPLFAALADST